MKPFVPEEPGFDERHMALRAALIRLRRYAHARMGQRGGAIRADELYERLTAALYPKSEDMRNEPLTSLLDAARRDEVEEHRNALTGIRERLLRIAGDVTDETLRQGLATIADGIHDFLSIDEETQPPQDEARPPS